MRQLSQLLLINLGIALVIVLITSSSSRNPRLDTLLVPGVISLAYSTVIGIASWWILPKVGPRFSKDPLLRWVQLLASLTAIALVGGSAAFLVMAYQPIWPIRIDYVPSMVLCLTFTLTIGSITYLVEEARYRVQAASLQLKTRELERDRALKSAADAKLQSLESRIHPHFLFNTLNSISSLVRSNPAKAEALIEQLAALLRFSLDRHGNLVSLADEVQITRDYLEIEKARFEERLRYSFEIPEDLLTATVPALSLQTLAENSVKYAVGTQRQGSDIHIRARRKGKEIELEVSDTGPGFSPDSLPAGHGLDTLKQRLDSHFGEAASLSTRRLDPGMEVAFRIPC